MDPDFTPTRIAANIVTGIGFLGAGAIIREGGRVAGLTTAATIWLSAALGMGIGAGELLFVSASTLTVVIVLLIFPRIEGWIDRIRESRSYKIVVSSASAKKMDKIQQALSDCSLYVLEHHQAKSADSIISAWRAIGSPKNHDKFLALMMRDKDIKEVNY